MQVGHATLSDRGERAVHEVDVIAFGERRQDGRKRVLLIGEAKHGQIMGPTHVERLRRIRDVLSRRDDLDLSDCRLACFSAQGFAAALTDDPRILLIDLNRLYIPVRSVRGLPRGRRPPTLASACLRPSANDCQIRTDWL
ncbi:MAG: hypothetical protein ACRD0K_16450 [Egibacteraceae bacterium]